MNPRLIALLLCAVFSRAVGAGSPLLNRAAEKWMTEADRWAFTMQVREFDHHGLKEERVEHFDPSRPAGERWTLVTVNGRAATAERQAAWRETKARKHQHEWKSLSAYFEFDNATLVGALPQALRYRLPLRSNHNWLFPVDHIVLTVTVNKATAAIEQVEAGLEKPFGMALGLASLLDVDLDMKMNSSEPLAAADGPADAHPAGLAQIVIVRLGKRVEYTWSGFRRVPLSPGNAAIGERNY
jgi:hypothetical protein